MLLCGSAELVLDDQSLTEMQGKSLLKLVLLCGSAELVLELVSGSYTYIPYYLY